MPKAKDIQAIRDLWRISVNGIELGESFITNAEGFTAEPQMPPKPINISFSVDMDKERYEEFAAAFRLYDESIRQRTLAYIAMIKKRKRIFGI